MPMHSSTPPLAQSHSATGQPPGPGEFHRLPVGYSPLLQSQSSIQMLSQELAAAQKRLWEYTNTISSLYAELELIRNIVCHACKEKISPAYLDVSAPVISPPADVRFDNAVSDSTVICNSLSSPEPTEAFFSPPETPLAQSPEEPEVEKSPWSVKYNSEIEQMLKITFVHPFEYAPIKAYSVRFSPCGNFLAAGLRLGSTHIHDVNTRSMKCALAEYPGYYKDKLYSAAVYCMCFSPDGQYLVVGGSLKTIYIWKIVNKRVVAMFKGHKSTVASLDVSPDGRLLVTTSYDNSVRIWKMRDGSSKLLSLEGNTPTSVKFSPNGRHVAVSNVDGFLRILDVRSGRLVGKWKGHEHRIASLAFSPDGEKLVSGDWDGSMRCWDVSPLNVSGSSTERHVLEDGMLVMKNKTLEFNQQLRVICFVAISPDGKWLVDGSSDNRLRIWDMHTGIWQCTLEGHVDVITMVDFSPAGDYIAAASLDGVVTLWKYQTM